ncbi:alpha/beta hydrolase [Agromyces endophyticus]|uniref:alpha/beta hydrolase n=1 Tax=Agromyces sp. H17E-10 TaxID=2932244 RepID=UPI001FD09F26|nr:alpha/beta hydrolase [Agromyces sp. H17E-10]UOQ90246.1 alpha/beta hydrolase [Agromyces sp. H17E-10]
MAWTEDHPSAGYPDQIRAVARARQDAADGIREAISRLDDARGIAEDDEWKGEAKSSFLTALDGPGPDLVVLADGFDHHAQLLRGYAGDLETLAETERALRERRDELHDDEAAATRELRVLAPPGFTTGDESEDERIARRRARYRETIEDARSGLDAVEHDWDELVRERRRIDRELAARLTDALSLGGAWRIDAETIASSSASALLEKLSELSEGDLALLLELHPELAETLIEADPNAVAELWATLSPEARRTLVNGIPEIVGNLGGVPYAARDLANRLVLDRTITRLEATGLGSQELSDLRAIREALATASKNYPMQLVSLDADAEPKPLAAISVGDLDTATNATFQVSGMYSSTSDMVNAVTDAKTMKRTEDEWATYLGLGGSTAVVAWIGYSSPDAITVLGEGHARTGAKLLEQELRAYDATVGTGTTLNINAHSYGTPTVAIALSQPGISADSFAMYGSAGLTGDVSLGGLHVPDGQVWAGETIDDPWAPTGRILSGRQDPADWTGVNEFGTNGGETDPISGERLAESHGHGEYLIPSSESVRNLALINLGRGDLVTSDLTTLAPGAPGDDSGGVV